MLGNARVLIGCGLIKLGMAILPAQTRKMFRNVIMFHVPGALTEEEKDDVREAKRQWKNGGLI